jgi:hypothetical protein
MKYAVEIGSGAMICVPSLINIGLGVQKLIGGSHRDRQTQTAWSSHKPTLGKLGKKEKKHIQAKYRNKTICII